MACLGVKLGVAKWKVQMNPLSYGGTLANVYFTIRYSNKSFVLYCFSEVSQLPLGVHYAPLLPPMRPRCHRPQLLLQKSASTKPSGQRDR